MERPPISRAALFAPPSRRAWPPARIAAATDRASAIVRPSSLSGSRGLRLRQSVSVGGVPWQAMSERRIGRVLVASLHQAIADLLPTRLEFYENWLNVSGLREGTIGLAPLSAVLSFLRNEGEAYGLITARAGTYAADWTVNSLSPLQRRVIRALPTALRLRAALRVTMTLVRSTYPGPHP